MVSLKTPDSPVEKKRIDFATMEEYINYLELKVKVEYQSTKHKMEKTSGIFPLKQGKLKMDLCTTISSLSARKAYKGDCRNK